MKKINLSIYTNILLLMFFACLCPQIALGQFYQKADYAESNVTRKNQLGGYDYYDKSGNKIGYSKKTHAGDYIYYDNEGNKTGVLKQDKSKKAYIYYNASNIPSGTLRKTTTGEYRYKNAREGGLTSVIPPPGENIGFVPPSSFQSGTFNSDLQGTFKKQEKQ